MQWTEKDDEELLHILTELDSNEEVHDNETDFDSNRVRNRMELTYYSELLQSNSKAIASSKQVIEEKISELQLLVNHCSSCEINNTVYSHLTSAITVVMAGSTMEALVASSIVVRKQPSHTSNSEKQFRFHSTEVQERRGVRGINGQNHHIRTKYYKRENGEHSG